MNAFDSIVFYTYFRKWLKNIAPVLLIGTIPVVGLFFFNIIEFIIGSIVVIGYIIYSAIMHFVWFRKELNHLYED